MGKEIHLSATAAVRRTLKGDTLSLSLQTNGVPLFQGLNLIRLPYRQNGARAERILSLLHLLALHVKTT